ncbi:MAG TPA: PaaI family thioesterase [Syntrophobacteraceae bacterium]|nr:PaaI family thioesterase [Syntrophobacteraceae bacterium]
MTKQHERTASSHTGPHSFQMKSWISCAPFERLLNMEIVEASEGHATLTMPFLVDYAQGAGLMHGGALVSLADTAVVMAIKSILPPLSHFATIHCETRFLRPVRKGIVTARAKVISRQDREFQGQATLYDEDGSTVLVFSSTFKMAGNAKIRGVVFEGDSAVPNHEPIGPCRKPKD